MEKIKEHIKTGEFKRYYLICGENDYMKNLYADKLKSALVNEGDTMNFSEYVGEKTDFEESMGMAYTMPFFADRRLIKFKDTGVFAVTNELDERLEGAEDTTVFLFVETKVDKRNKLYKFIKSKGYVCEINDLDEKTYLAFINKCFTGTSVTIDGACASYLLECVGTDMNTLINECEKLTAYCMDKGKVEKADIDNISSILLENKIFEMIDCLAAKDKAKALKLYGDLIKLRESPIKILKLISRHFNILYIIKSGMGQSLPQDKIIATAKIPPFALKKYSAHVRNYTENELLDYVKWCTDIEEDFKSGRIDVNIALEMLLCK